MAKKQQIRQTEEAAGILWIAWAHNPKVGGSNPPPATNLKAILSKLSSTVQPMRRRSVRVLVAFWSHFANGAHGAPVWLFTEECRLDNLK